MILLCYKCKENKDEAEFAIARSHALGRFYTCRPCAAIASKAYYAKNADSIRARTNAWKKSNKARVVAYMTAWRSENRDLDRSITAAWRSANGERMAEYSRGRRAQSLASTRRRQAAKIERTPLWADHEENQRRYDWAAMISDHTGVPHEVDHIIPLRGRSVCGLHWHGNLMVVTRAENRAKGHTRWPDMAI